MLPNTVGPEDDLYILYLERFGTSIKYMSLTGNEDGYSSDFALSLVAQHCPAVECLKLTSSSLKSGRPFEILFTGCTHINSLTIENCGQSNESEEPVSDPIHEFAYIGLASSCSGLIFLNLIGSGISHTDLSALLGRCPDINSLELQECTNCAEFMLPSTCKKLTTFYTSSVLIGDTTLVAIA